jgi:hypothetical protein
MIKCENIINLFGNHDEHLEADENLQNLFMCCLDTLKFRINGTLYHCFHFPIDKEWDEANRGSVHLFGHRHTMEKRFLHGRSLDVGLDSNGLMPYNLAELHDEMMSIPVARNHH